MSQFPAVSYEYNNSVSAFYNCVLPCCFSKDVLDSKNSAIKDLQYELARVCKVNIFFSVFFFSLPGLRTPEHVIKQSYSL